MNQNEIDETEQAGAPASCSTYPTPLTDPARILEMIKAGFLVMETDSYKTVEFLKLENVYRDELYFKNNNKTFRVTHIAMPIVFHRTNVSVNGDYFNCGYVVGFDIRGAQGVSSIPQTFATSNVSFLRKEDI